MFSLRSWARYMYIVSAKANVITPGMKLATQTQSLGLLNAHELTTDHWKAEKLCCPVAWCFLGLQAENISTGSGQTSSLKLTCPI